MIDMVKVISVMLQKQLQPTDVVIMYITIDEDDTEESWPYDSNRITVEMNNPSRSPKNKTIIILIFNLVILLA